MWILLLPTVFLLTAEISAKIVNTVYGQVDGNTVTLDDGSIINSWYGVPFAAPPVEALRFEVRYLQALHANPHCTHLQAF